MTPPPAGRASLRDLHDIVVPDGVPWWPPAPAWYVLGTAALVAAAWLVAVAWRRHRALRYRRAALSELRALRHRVTGGAPPGDCVRDAAVLLKRVAIRVHARERVAALSGKGWVGFLDEHGGDAGFRGEAAATLARDVYGDHATIDPGRAVAVLDAVEGWIRAQGLPHDGTGRATA
ncbi:MAG: DUF4381 domain-containing protein [Planctomycetota bacterium]